MKKVFIGVFLLAVIFAINTENNTSSDLLASNIEALAQGGGGGGDVWGNSPDIYPNGRPPGSNFDVYGNWIGWDGAGGSAGDDGGGEGGGDWRPPAPFPYCIKGATGDNEKGVDLPACNNIMQCFRNLILPKGINVNLCTDKI